MGIGISPVQLLPIGVLENGSKIGYSTNVGTGNFVALSNVTTVNPTGEHAAIVSTSIEDSSNGTGIQQVKIRYFDTNFTLNDEIISLNGTTSVNTLSTNILLIESFEAYKIGSNPFGSVGTITLTSTDTTRLFAQIDPNTTLFPRSMHFVAPGKQNEIIDIILSCPTSGGVQFVLFISVDNTSGGGNIVPIPDTTYLLAGESSQISFSIPIFTDASTSTQPLSIGIGVKGLAASQTASGTFHFRERFVK